MLQLHILYLLFQCNTYNYEIYMYKVRVNIVYYNYISYVVFRFIMKCVPKDHVNILGYNYIFCITCFILTFMPKVRVNIICYNYICCILFSFSATLIIMRSGYCGCSICQHFCVLVRNIGSCKRFCMPCV